MKRNNLKRWGYKINEPAMGCFVARMLCFVANTHAALLRRRRRRRFGYVQNFLGNLHCQKVVDSTRNLTILWLRSHCAGRGSQSFIRLIYCVAYDIGIMPVWGGGRARERESEAGWKDICGRFNVAAFREFHLDDKSKTLALFIGLVREFVYDTALTTNVIIKWHLYF